MKMGYGVIFTVEDNEGCISKILSTETEIIDNQIEIKKDIIFAEIKNNSVLIVIKNYKICSQNKIDLISKMEKI